MIAIIATMSFQDWMMLMQNVILFVSLGFAWLQLKKFRRERGTSIMNDLEPIFKSYHALNRPEYDRVMTSIRRVLENQGLPSAQSSSSKCQPLHRQAKSRVE